MKHGKKPTVAQRKIITRLGLDWENWLIVKNTPDSIVIVHRLTGSQRRIDKCT